MVSFRILFDVTVHSVHKQFILHTVQTKLGLAVRICDKVAVPVYVSVPQRSQLVSYPDLFRIQGEAGFQVVCCLPGIKGTYIFVHPNACILKGLESPGAQ